jgi:signal transduction histidine kinase
MRAAFRRVALDVLLAGAMTVLVLVTVAHSVDDDARVTASVVGVLSVAPLAVRQLIPVLTMVAVLLGLMSYSLLGYGDFPNVAGGGLVIAMFTVAVLRSRPVAAVMWAATAAAIAVTFVASDFPVTWSEAMRALLVMLGGGWILGEGTRCWARRAERLASETAAAVARERACIAGELHDVVAHHMSVISIQAGVAESVLDRDPPAARTAIATVGSSSREALTEMRRLLHVLRDTDTDTKLDRTRTPGLASLDELADRVRDAGVPVQLVVKGRARPLSPGPDLCAYRVAQESLTNVLKHAGPATARIYIDYGEEMLTLNVSDTGASAGTSKRSADSYGIRGMRERAALYGGDLTARPAEGGGFEVTLRLPIDEAP